MSDSGPERSPEGILQGPTPPISLTMTLDSPVWRLSTDNDKRPNFIITIASHFNHPITLRSLGTVLDARHIYQGPFIYQHFSVTNLDSGRRIYYSGSEPQLCRPPGPRLITLHPNESLVFSYGVPCLNYNNRFNGGGNGKLTFTPRSGEMGGEVFSRYFEPGHRYRIRIQNQFKRRVWEQLPEREEYQVDFWWRYGTKEQVTKELNGGGYMEWSENPIRISGIPDVELAIEE